MKTFVRMYYFNLCIIGVVVVDGLLYVMGGEAESKMCNTLEIYNPNTNTWSMEILSRGKNDGTNIKLYGGVVVDCPPTFYN